MMRQYRTLIRFIAGAGLLWAAAATAQQQARPDRPVEEDEPIQVGVDVARPLPIAVPYMPTPSAANTAAGNTENLGRQVAEIVSTDLRNSGLFTPMGPSGLRPVTFPQVTAPDFPYYSSLGTPNLVQGYVQANGDGNITVGCYLYDVAAQSELTRQGY